MIVQGPPDFALTEVDRRYFDMISLEGRSTDKAWSSSSSNSSSSLFIGIFCNLLLDLAGQTRESPHINRSLLNLLLQIVGKKPYQCHLIVFFQITRPKGKRYERVENSKRRRVKVTEGIMVVRSNGLTQTDRDYFNIVKTEDGLSDFLRLNPKNQKRRKSKMQNNFLYHTVRGEEGEKVAALYLASVT